MEKLILFLFLPFVLHLQLFSQNEEVCKKIRLNYSALKNKCVTNEEACEIIGLIYDKKTDECISKEEECEKNGLIYDNDTNSCKSKELRTQDQINSSIEYERKLQKGEICTPEPGYPECDKGLECRSFAHLGLFKCKPKE